MQTGPRAALLAARGPSSLKDQVPD